MQGLPQDWIFPQVTLRVAIMICHVVLQQHWVPALKFFQTCHFNHLARGSECFRDMKESEVHKESSTNKGLME